MARRREGPACETRSSRRCTTKRRMAWRGSRSTEPTCTTPSTSRWRPSSSTCGGRLRGDAEVRCVVLTGAGDASFCTGIDRGEAMDHLLEGPDAAQAVRRRGRLAPRRSGPPHRPEVERPVEARDRGGQRHGVRRRLLPARRGGVHHRGRARHLLRSARHLRDDRLPRVDAHASEDAVPRDHALGAARCARTRVGAARLRDRVRVGGGSQGRAE